MKKTIIFILSIFIFTVCNSQTKMTAADSAAKLQQELNKFIDSLVLKTTVREFMDFLYTNTTGKQANEEKWVVLYDFFVRTKASQWVAEQEKKKKPPPKN